MRNASVHQDENERQWKKREQEHGRLDFRRLPGPGGWVRAHFPEQRLVIEPRTRKFLEVSRCSRAKQRKRNVQKSVLHA